MRGGYVMILSARFDRPLMNSDSISKINVDLVTELDWQLFQLQRKYLDYQVNIGNRIIETLQSGEADAAEKAQQISQPKKRFQDILDDLFTETGKKIIRSENEIKFSSLGGGTGSLSVVKWREADFGYPADCIGRRQSNITFSLWTSRR